MPRSRAELVPILLMAAALAGLLGTVAFLVDQEAAAQAADNAEISILAESSLSASAAARNAASFAVVLAAQGSTAEVRDEGLAHLEEAIDLFTQRHEKLATEVTPGELRAMATPIEAFVEQLTGLRRSVRNSDVEAALGALGQVSESYNGVVAAVGEIRDNRSADALAAGDDVGRAATLVRFLIIFVIPLALLLVFWRKMRRKTNESLLEAELAHEREISKAKDRFIADISHELRTPLTGIYGFATSIEEYESSLSEEGSEMLNLIITESAELSRMVDDLVTAGRLDAGALAYQFQEVALDSEIEAVVDPFRRKGLKVEVESAGVVAKADRLRLRQILRNLVSNAAKYGHGEMSVMAYQSGDRAVIEVLDNGPGVAPDIEERLFQRYVHDEGHALLEGSVGLGLAIASSLTRGMRGELEYRRVEDVTVFRVTLPVADRTKEGRRPPAPSMSY